MAALAHRAVPKPDALAPGGQNARQQAMPSVRPERVDGRRGPRQLAIDHDN